VEKVLINILVGGGMTCVFGLVAYLLREKVDTQALTLNTFKAQIERDLRNSAFDTSTKARMKALLDGLSKVEGDMARMRPDIAKSTQNYGKIMWIQEKLEAQDTKLKGLYDVMLKIVHSQKP